METKQNRLIWEAESYDVAGKVTAERFGNGLKTRRSFDVQEGRPRYITTSRQNGIRVNDWRYDYDAVGNITRIETENGDLIREHFFDSLNRLVRVTDAVRGQLYSFEYSPAGNLLRRGAKQRFYYGNRGYGPHAATGHRSEGVSQLYDYDSRGNLVSDGVRSFVYDGRGLISEMNSRSLQMKVAHDQDGERLKTERTQPGDTDKTSTIYIGDTFRQSRDKQGVVSRSFITVGGELVGIYIEVDLPNSGTSSALIFAHLDHAGSVRTLSDEKAEILAEIDYGPFGTPAVDIKSDRHSIKRWVYDKTFTGLEFDYDFGVLNAKSRLLDSDVGRFLGADPVFVAGMSSQELNRYAYASNNPVHYTDRTGLARQYSVMGESSRADRDRYFRERRDWSDRQLDRLRMQREMREGRFNTRDYLDRTPKLQSPKLGDSVFRDREPHYTLFPRTPAVPRGHSIDRNTARMENRNLLSWPGKAAEWYESVKSGGLWDYKKQSGEWQDLGNFNYGATGAALGLPDEVLLRGAGWYQEVKTPKGYDPSYGHWWNPFSPSRGDDPKDQWQIRQGIDYYRHRELIRWLEGEPMPLPSVRGNAGNSAAGQSFTPP
jgi:RHS repeat-associated protein